MPGSEEMMQACSAMMRAADGLEPMRGSSMMGGWMLLWSLLLLALVVLGIVLVIRALRSPDERGGDAAPPRPDALKVLEERFARGEIDRQEFEERRRTLLS